MSTGENTIMGTLKAGFKDAKTRFVVLCALAIIGILWNTLGKKTKSSDEFILKQLTNCEKQYNQLKAECENQKDSLNNYWYHEVRNVNKELNDFIKQTNELKSKIKVK